ncbi:MULTISPECIES: Flp pilus assembly protein CpaB [unclassified Vibrio]|uniref:Flp pilus assembly protein CpaB n=1 Tax=Vibrio sp. HB236076 TaxID=3232307 RepID=A0AB39HF70_9VIBR|nr:Flp pilus assembly protein CpaB [Vibrio sp. HB161653]MDP5253177.1 Flp pilus assembly protein CpaB [Vibrio sp. HB161653]
MRSRLVLLLALIAVVIGVIGVMDALKKKPQVVNEPVVKQEVAPETYVTVWQATQDLNQGQPLSQAQVQKQQLPLSEAVKVGAKQDVALDFSPSTLLNKNIHSGEYILSDYQTKPNAPGYIDLLISPGMTLYPLTVDKQTLINDYIRPGSHIDILTVSSPSTNLAGEADQPKRFSGLEARMFMQKVKVLSIQGDGDTAAQVEKKVSSRVSVSNGNNVTLVIEIEPDQVARLALAERTMHMEVYRSQAYRQSPVAKMDQVIENYNNIVEYRGSQKTATFGGE